MKFNTVIAKDFCDSVRDGTHDSPKRVDVGYKLITSKHIKGNQIDFNEAYNISEEDFNKINERSKVDTNDVLFSMIGTVGLVYRVSEAPNYAIKNMGLFKISDALKSKWLYYYLQSLGAKEYINKSLTGSTQKYVTLNSLREMPISYPENDNDARKIVKILSDIDAKIECNNRINEKLFNISQSTYKEWFIKFKHPKIGDFRQSTELGDIPDGWTIGNIDDNKLTKIVKSGVNEYRGDKKYIATADVNSREITSYTLLKYNERPSRANMEPIENSVWFAKMENSVKNILVTDKHQELIDKYIFSTGFMGLECLEDSTLYIWNYINNDSFLETKNNLSTGTLMAGVSNSTIKSAKYIIPPHNLILEFNEVVSPIFEKIHKNYIENEKFANLRNALLPELLSGNINVDKVEVNL